MKVYADQPGAPTVCIDIEALGWLLAFPGRTSAVDGGVFV
jgi:hypothetical protein